MLVNTTVPRHFRRMRPRTIVQSVKNQFQTDQSILDNVLIQDFVATATEVGTPTKVTGKEVPVGAIVKSLFISVNFVSGSSNETGNFEWCLMKLREGQSVVTLITNPNWTNIGLGSGRNQVIKSFMAIFGTEDAGSIRYNLQIKIPRLYQRMRSGDSFVLALQSSAAGSLSTGARYKYYQ